MSVIVDLLESRIWVDTDSKWPDWLNASWLTKQDARMICQLSQPDDLAVLRTIVPDPRRLIAYPIYSTLQEHLSHEDVDLVHGTFLQCLGADRHLVLSPSSGDQDCLETPKPPARPKPQTRNPRLALVSPLPPTASGIANYCAEILPDLAHSYNITLVVAEPDNLDCELTGQFDVISHRQMLQQRRQFDRVMYHFGNSPFHYDYFLLLKAYPGIVVLHDIFLGDCILSNRAQLGNNELFQSIYTSHGWAAMPDCDGPVKQPIELYPACSSVFGDSYGVIVHNQFAKEILTQHFCAETLSTLISIPLARKLKPLPEKSRARLELGISEDSILYSSFGLINSNKCLNELMDSWSRSGLAENESARLCLVGGCSDQVIERKVESWISHLPHPKQAILTGYASPEEYDLYLSATDVAIQLRRNSRGESSAALLDCLGAGLPTIINSHGSMAEIPDAVVFKLSDEFTVSELAQMLAFTFANPDKRTTIGEKARPYVEQYHSPKRIVSSYTEYIESQYQQSPEALITQLHQEILGPKIRELPADKIFTCSEELNDLMRCAKAGGSALAGSQLFVDISAVVRHDLKTGIQRVVRNILRELLQNSCLGYRVEPVYYDFDSECFRYARSFTNHFISLPPFYLSDDPVEARPGDIYLGLDLYYSIAEREPSRRWLQYWRGRGVKVHHVLYDLLPVALPECFPADSVPHFTNWLNAITQVSDGITCISKAVANEYSQWLEQQGVSPRTRPNVGYFHLGAEMETRIDEEAFSDDEEEQMKEIQHQPYLLMVGTIEPRKGHEQVLAAFDELWAQGHRLSLVIVGSMGWVNAELSDRLKRKSETSTTLYWLDFVSDSMLKSLYQKAAGTIMASRGEGFGLPLIEAAHYGSPLLARDLPVFREVCGDHAWFFDSIDGPGLARELQNWMKLRDQATLPDSSCIQSINWAQSSEQLTSSIISPHRKTDMSAGK